MLYQAVQLILVEVVVDLVDGLQLMRAQVVPDIVLIAYPS
jgi:hypothetical protein